MSSTTLLIIIMAIVLAEYLLSEWLSFRNSKSSKLPVPQQLEGLYDAEKYEKQQRYFRVNSRFSFVSSTFSTIVMLLLLSTQLFGELYEYCSSITTHIIAVNIIFFGIILIASDITTLPFQIYETFVIEERFGFNKTTVKTFIGDKIKSLFLTIILGGGLLSLIVWLYTLLGTNFWWAAFCVAISFSLVMSMFYSQLIVPLFNKQTPLPEGELRDEINEFAQRAGFKITNIYVIDGSKRTTKANAYFTGLGKKKRIVLYDTLIEELTTKEVVAVLAHEIGHYKKRHTLQNFFMSGLAMLIQLYILSLTLTNVTMAEAMGASEPVFALSLIAFGILYTPVDLLTGLFMNSVSRRAEYQADDFAAKYGLGEELITSLKKLSVKSLSNLTPDKLYVKFYYSHPTLLQRILAIKKD
ncbi:MAG: M48 family metallopeptidase [Bacteroidales bacterium]|nr:M48 family metallopeptidase [Bacteroidales bacterium]